jgi:hypothetical protein
MVTKHFFFGLVILTSLCNASFAQCIPQDFRNDIVWACGSECISRGMVCDGLHKNDANLIGRGFNSCQPQHARDNLRHCEASVPGSILTVAKELCTEVCKR